MCWRKRASDILTIRADSKHGNEAERVKVYLLVEIVVRMKEAIRDLGTLIWTCSTL